MPSELLDRRTALKLAVAALATPWTTAGAADDDELMSRPIPVSGERLPVIGLGTSGEFDRPPADDQEAAELRGVLDTFVATGARLVDTAPSYGDAEAVLGRLAREAGLTQRIFWATKIRASGEAGGIAQFEASERHLGRRPLDLVQVHNLVDAATQWRTLRNFKEQERVRYIGLTTHRQADHEAMEGLMRDWRPDFVQLNYSPMEPQAAARLLPLAAERGIAVLVNRPFGNGDYFSLVRGRPLPDWSADFDCESWAQLALKFILAQPAVTCVIPATSRPRHVIDNVRAGQGRLPDAAQQARIRELVATL